jgi:hypothetical protein
MAPRLTQPWQARARFFARHLGVVRFANGLTATSASRVRLVPERRASPGSNEFIAIDPSTDPAALAVQEIIAGYRNHRDSTQELLRRHVWQYKTPGEMVQIVEEGPQGYEWSIVSTSQCEFRRDGVLVRDIPGGTFYDGSARLVPLAQARRFWTPDEDWPGLATSPLEGVLADCERYWSLGRRIRRETESVLGMAGVLWTPEEAHTYPLRPNGASDSVSKQDRQFWEIARSAFGDDDSVEAVAPFSLHYSGTFTEPRWVNIGRMLDPRTFEARREALECIARGLDPPQKIIVSGPGEANHWGDWALDEAFVKTSLSPVLDTICHGDLTEATLHPMLRWYAQTKGWAGNPEDWRMGYDAVDLIVHPDRAAVSVDIWSKGGLKLARMLDENGFTGADAPDEEELAQFLKIQQALHARPGFGQNGGPLADSVLEPGGSAATTRELPPAPALSALGPYPAEVGSWLD